MLSPVTPINQQPATSNQDQSTGNQQLTSKKVLIVTYYWPPSGGSGVQRWLKFVRYLRDFGWEPVVYTAENAEYPELDPELQNEIPSGVEVIRRPIWEPYNFYKKFIGQKKGERVVS